MLDGMSLSQIALAAECITLARIDFAQKVYLEPLLSLVGSVKKPPQTGKERNRLRAKQGRQTAEQRDAKISALASTLGIDIEDV